MTVLSKYSRYENPDFAPVKGYVYGYYDTKGKCLYVGSTWDIKMRKEQHLYSFNDRMSFPFYNYLRQEGLVIEELQFKILVESYFYSMKDRLLFEQQWINSEYPKCNVGNAPYNHKQKTKKYNSKYAKEERIIIARAKKQKKEIEEKETGRFGPSQIWEMYNFIKSL